MSGATGALSAREVVTNVDEMSVLVMIVAMHRIALRARSADKTRARRVPSRAERMPESVLMTAQRVRAGVADGGAAGAAAVVAAEPMVPRIRTSARYGSTIFF